MHLKRVRPLSWQSQRSSPHLFMRFINVLRPKRQTTPNSVGQGPRLLVAVCGNGIARDQGSDMRGSQGCRFMQQSARAAACSC